LLREGSTSALPASPYRISASDNIGYVNRLRERRELALRHRHVEGRFGKDCPSGLTSSGCYAQKQGSVILGTAGDGSDGGTGTWCEGAITLGAPPDTTDAAVQANIVAAGYGK